MRSCNVTMLFLLLSSVTTAFHKSSIPLTIINRTKEFHVLTNVFKKDTIKQINKHLYTRYFFLSRRCNSSNSLDKVDENCHHYIFGYGSLICSESRAMSAPEQSQKVVTPVVVKGVQTIWSKRVARGMTALGVKVDEDDSDMTMIHDENRKTMNKQLSLEQSQCIGVLLPVNNDELERFDEREQGYKRKSIDLERIEPVPFLDYTEHYSHPNHQKFLKAKEKIKQQKKLLGSSNISNSNSNIKVWLYVPEQYVLPSDEYPIVQSYVDTILRGCLSISEQFAHEFIQRTKGWDPKEFENDDAVTVGSGTGSSSLNHFYVDDRNDPIYPRGDPNWSRLQATKIDSLIQKHRPRIFGYRSPRTKHSQQPQQQSLSSPPQ